MKRMNKKGSAFGSLSELAMALGTFAVVIIVVLMILASGQDYIADTSGIINTSNVSELTTAYNASQTLQEGYGQLPDWMPLIVIAGVGSVLIGLVVLFKRR